MYLIYFRLTINDSASCSSRFTSLNDIDNISSVISIRATRPETQQEQITNAIVKMIVEDMLPLSFVEGKKVLNIPQHKLIQTIKTRWNSVYYMFDRLYEQKIAIEHVLEDRNIISVAQSLKYKLTVHEWQLIKKILEVLKPFEMATKMMCGEHTTTISIAQPAVISLRDNFLKEGSDDTESIKVFKYTVQEELNKRFQLEIDTDITLYDICQFLDPRYKNVQKQLGINLKVKEYLEQIIEKHVTTVTANPMWHVNQEKTAVDFLFPSNAVVNQKELDEYYGEVPINKNLCPLQWWQNNEQRYPKLASLVKMYLQVPATSTPSERVFSTAGSLISAKRSCLNGRTADMLIFLHNNIKSENLV